MIHRRIAVLTSQKLSVSLTSISFFFLAWHCTLVPVFFISFLFSDQVDIQSTSLPFLFSNFFFTTLRFPPVFSPCATSYALRLFQPLPESRQHDTLRPLASLLIFLRLPPPSYFPDAL